MSRTWSLQGRVASRLAVSTLALVASLTGLSVWFLGSSVDRQLEGLALEEVEELRALFLASPQEIADFERVTGDLAALHPDTPLAWRLWSGDGRAWASTGPARTRALLPADRGTGDGGRFVGPGFFWRTVALEGGRVAGVLVDGTGRMASLRRQEILIFTIGAVLALVMIGGGVLFARHVSRLLQRVAANARAGGSIAAANDLAPEDAPEEIRDVAVALTEMRRGIRVETERQQLLAAGLAHELRSPIQNLLGESEVALLRERGADEYRRVLESHIEELRDLARVVDNLVTLCASAPPDSARELESFDLGHEAALRLEKESARAARGDVKLELVPEGDLACRGDREALLLALRNVVGNAVTWSPPGATVRVGLTGNRDGIDVTVDDAGPGIPAEERERIFHPFYRGRAASGRRAGYGLGLALTRAALEAHRGVVEVTSSPAGGARVQLRLPRNGSGD